MGFETLHDAEGQFFRKNRVASGDKVFELRANDRMPTDLRQDPFSANIENAVQPDNMYFPSLSYDGRLWTPRLTNTLVWHDASDLSTITSSLGSVSQIDDKSGAGYHFLQGLGFRQPSTGLSTIGGLNALGFDGNDLMRANGFVLPTDKNFSVYMVASVDAVTVNGDSIISFEGAITNENAGFSLAGDPNLSTVFTPYVRDPSIAANTFTGGPWQGINLYEIVFNADTLLIDGYITGTKRMDGTNWGNNYNPNQYDAIQDLLLFSYIYEAFQPTGLFGEWVVIPQTDTDSRQQIEGYLSWKWGLEGSLPADHPYKNLAPGDYSY